MAGKSQGSEKKAASKSPVKKGTTKKPAAARSKKSPPKAELKATRESLSGWGRHSSSWTMGVLPGTDVELAGSTGVKAPAILPRGAGRAYGDAAMNEGGVTVHLDRLDRAVSFDEIEGVIVCEAGMTLADVLKVSVPRGWFLPVTPGTAHPTIGGSVACDVHGKNHHVSGTLGAHVKWVDLIIADGQMVRCSPRKNKTIFDATIGGMGLTGIIYRLALQMEKIQTSYIVEDQSRVSGLREMMDVITEGDKKYPFTVTWVDGATPGKNMGQGHIMLGRWAKKKDLPEKAKATPLAVASDMAIPVPFLPPFSLVNNLTVKIFNAVQIRRAPFKQRTHVVPYRPYFYPLDIAKDWHRLYGPKGFYQYQYTVPFDEGEAVIRETFDRLQKAGKDPSLIVLKRLGDEGSGYLSFPKPGWNIAIDIPITDGLDSLLNGLDTMVAMAGGRIYLVKDARMSPEMFRRMYPRFERFMKVKEEIDPKWRFSSDLSRRLKMEEGV